MHPSKDIMRAKGAELDGRSIVLCVTGSVAAMRCPELARELMRHGAEVRACMSRRAAELITPYMMHWATGNEVVVQLTGKLEHVELAGWADLILVAPATANTISKIAWGVDDTPVTSVVSVALGLGKPLIVVPAMHVSMFEHKFLQENLLRLRSAGIWLVEPTIAEGKAKIASVEEIVQTVMRALGPRDMQGVRVLVTAGPTIEPIDPVKIITNRSSGKMGFAVARVAASRGAEVTLITGPSAEMPPFNVKLVRVQTTKEMRDAFVKELESGVGVVVGTAAAQDFVVERPAEKKLRHSESLVVKLVPAPRILAGIRQLAPDAFVVGFKAEHQVGDDELLRAAKEKLDEGLDMVVANDVARPGAGFGTDTNQVLILTKKGSRTMSASKSEIARAVLDEVVAGMR